MYAVCNMGFAVCPRHTANYSIPVVTRVIRVGTPITFILFLINTLMYSYF